MALAQIQLTPQLIHAVRDAVSIEAIASEHTRLRKAGKRLVGLCPLHKEKTPSFSVDPVQGLFYCFGCGQGGDAIKLHMATTGDDFPAAIESLARRYGIPLPAAPARRRGERPEERDLEAVLEAGQRFFRDQFERHAAPRRYLERRQIAPELVERYGLGYAPEGWRNLIGALHPGIPLADLEAAGLVARPEGSGDPYDRFRNRLMFPIRSPSGRLLGFGGRALGDDPAKYLNTAETDRFHKGYVLYGLDHAKRAVREAGKVLLVEGYFDVLAAVAAGIEWTVASMGTALTAEQARLLARYAEEIVVGYDGDDAGEAASRRALAILLGEGVGVRRARFGTGRDPDSLRLEAGAEALRQAVEEAGDFVELEVARLVPSGLERTPRLRAKAAQAVAELLRPIRDGILRFGYGRLAADRLGVPVELLWKRLGVDREALKPPAAVRAEAKPVGSQELEKRLLELLLAGSEAPPIERLPRPEAFLDPTFRNIYDVYLRLYQSGSGSPPGARELLHELATEGEVIDQIAGILIKDPPLPLPGELVERLQQLARRDQRRRAEELTRAIAEAVRSGNTDRLQALQAEKASLNQILHPRPVARREGIF
jgi:DNA primase